MKVHRPNHKKNAADPSAPVELTERERGFCAHYLANGGNATQAAISAGYSKGGARTHGSKLLRMPHIKAHMDTFRRAVDDTAIVTLEYKLRKLKLCIERTMPDGDHIRPIETNPTAFISAIAELNRMQGHYSPDRSNITVGTVQDELVNGLIKKYERDY